LTATVTVTAPGGGTPAGSVTFYQFQNFQLVQLGTAPLNKGSASISTSFSTAGTRQITATFTPSSSNYTGSSGQMSEQVN
jgi:hypothetical protein